MTKCEIYVPSCFQHWKDGKTDDALYYEVEDMEKAVSGVADEMHLDYTTDVMSIMTDIRREWGLLYPEEQ